MIKNNEYEDIGENIFPLEYLTKEEIQELGIKQGKCCKQNNKALKADSKDKCNTCSGCKGCCKKK